MFQSTGAAAAKRRAPSEHQLHAYVPDMEYCSSVFESGVELSAYKERFHVAKYDLGKVRLKQMPSVVFPLAFTVHDLHGSPLETCPASCKPSYF